MQAWPAAAAACKGSGICPPSGLLCWLCAAATDGGSFPARCVPMTLPPVGLSWGRHPPRTLAASTKRRRLPYSSPSCTSEPADGDAEKPASEREATRGSIFLFTQSWQCEKQCVMGNRDSLQEGSGFSDHWRQDMLSAFIFLGTWHRADLQRLLVENNIQEP